MPTFVPIPELDTFLEQTEDVGLDFCATIATLYAEYLAANTTNSIEIWYENGYATHYYDFPNSAFAIADHYDSIGDSAKAATFRAAAIQNLTVNLGVYVVPNSFAIGGWLNFTRSPLRAYRYDNNTYWRDAVVSYRDGCSYGPSWVPDSWFAPVEKVLRETTYHIQANLDAKKAGYEHPAQYAGRREKFFEYFPWFFETFDWTGWNYQCSPFMIGLAARTMIEDWKITKDSRTLPLLRKACNYMWDNCHRPATKSLVYNWNPYYDSANPSVNPETPTYDVAGDAGAPDLNNMIAGLYAFMAWQDEDQTQMDRADELFEGAALNGYWVPGKQWNQMQTWVRGEDGYFGYREKFYAPTSTSRRLIRRRGI